MFQQIFTLFVNQLFHQRHTKQEAENPIFINYELKNTISY